MKGVPGMNRDLRIRLFPCIGKIREKPGDCYRDHQQHEKDAQGKGLRIKRLQFFYDSVHLESIGILKPMKHPACGSPMAECASEVLHSLILTRQCITLFFFAAVR